MNYYKNSAYALSKSYEPEDAHSEIPHPRPLPHAGAVA